MSQISRRAMLRGSVLAGASIPLLSFRTAVDQWMRDEYAPVPSVSGKPLVRLSHNENPYGPSAPARQALIAAIDQGNRYPRKAIDNLKQTIADYEGISTDQILISAGSTELLGVAGLMAGMQEGKVIGCHPTFPFLMSYASRFTAQWVKVPVTNDHQYNLAGINEKLDKNTKLVFICNPNNPTGSELPRSVLEPFCKTISERCMVYVDEAYIEFATGGLSSSLRDLTKNNKNIIVGRTFSKIYGMAGLRVGYAIAHPDTISVLEDLMMGGSVTPSVTSVEAAIASIGDAHFIAHCFERNAEARDSVCSTFKSWGVEYIPSVTNFVLFKTERFGDTNVYDALAEQNIMIRTYSDVPGWARVSIGTLDEMKTFLSATEGLLV